MVVCFGAKGYFCVETKNKTSMRYSILIPVYNRPHELDELLESLTKQTCKAFEVIVVDDGSETKSDAVVAKYAEQFTLRYFYKENSGPGPTRNYAAAYASGEYLLILDSDCIVPPHYIESIEQELQTSPCDAFGGSDCAHHSFTPTQKAISYSMTSFFTTGGIRGGKKKLDRFYPRSFNLGIRKKTFDALNGFSAMRFGEDIDLSIRIFDNGYSCRLFPEAWVYHKRRTDLKKFFKQVHNSGIARINLYKRHPHSLKLVHTLPALFTLGLALCIILALWQPLLLLLPLIYACILCTDAAIQYKSLKIGILAIAASYVQLIGYGTGFIRAWWQRIVLKQPEFGAFTHNFYK